MDYTTTAQERGYWPSLRIRCPRAKKRALREHREKQMLKLERELVTISTLQHNLGEVPLRPPIMRGWKRTFVLRADVAAGPKAAFYQGILDRINVTDYHHDRKFMVKKRKFGRKIKVLKELHLPKLYAWQWGKARFSEKEKLQFGKEEHHDDRGRPYLLYVFRDRWRFVPRVSPNLITRVRVRSIELETRKKWIENQFEYNDSWNKIRRRRGIRSDSGSSRYHQRQLKNQVPRNTLQWLNSLDD